MRAGNYALLVRHGEADCSGDVVDAVAVDMDDRCSDGLGEIGSVEGGAASGRGRRVPELVVDLSQFVSYSKRG